MRLFKLAFFSFLISSLSSGAEKSLAATVPEKYDLSKQETSVEFLAVGKPSLIKIKGDGAKLSGTIEIVENQIKGEFRVPLKDLTTGIELRDKHMKEKYLQIDKFPEAIFTISKIDLPNDFLAQKKIFSAVPFSGKINIKGVDKEIQGIADIDTTTSIVDVKTEFKAQISSFQIDIPSYVGIKIADEVTIKTTMKLKK